MTLYDAIEDVAVRTEQLIVELDCICERAEIDSWEGIGSWEADRPIADRHYGLVHLAGIREELDKFHGLELGITWHVYAVCVPDITSVCGRSAPSALQLSYDLATDVHWRLKYSIAELPLESRSDVDQAWSVCCGILRERGLDMATVGWLRARFEKERHLVLFALDRGKFTEADYARWSVKPDASIVGPDKQTDTSRKLRSMLPANADVVRLARAIRSRANTGESKQVIALEFTNGDAGKAQSLLRQLRPDRYGHLLE